MHTFSPEDLLRYLYQETDPQITAAIELALSTDWTLREKLAVMKTSKERLDNLTVSPRTEVILNVLRHARNTADKVTS